MGGECSTLISLINKTPFTIVIDNVNEIDNYDWYEGHTPSNLRGRRIPSLNSTEATCKLYTGASNCPFRMWCATEEGNYQCNFRINQQYARGKADCLLVHCTNADGMLNVNCSSSNGDSPKVTITIAMSQKYEEQQRQRERERGKLEQERRQLDKLAELQRMEQERQAGLQKRRKMMGEQKEQELERANACFKLGWDLNVAGEDGSGAKVQFEGAKKLYNEVLGKLSAGDEETTDLTLKISIIDLKLGGTTAYDEGIDLVDRAIELQQKARQMLSQKDFSEAKKLYTRALEKYNLAISLFQEGMDKGFSQFENCIDIVVQEIQRTQEDLQQCITEANIASLAQQVEFQEGAVTNSAINSTETAANEFINEQRNQRLTKRHVLLTAE